MDLGRGSKNLALVFLLVSIILLAYSGSDASAFQASQDVVTSNDECLPGSSVVHCLNQQLPDNGEGFNVSSTSSSMPATQNQPSNITTQGFLYVENAKSNSVSVIDLATNAVIKNITIGKSPHDIKISDDQQTVYTTDIDSGTVSIINATNNTLITQIDTGGRAVHGIAIFNDTLYVGDVYGGKILVIKDDQIKEEIQAGSGPEYVEISPDGRFLYVANLWSPISVIDLHSQNKTVIKEIDSGKTPHGLSFTDDGSRLFIVNMESDTISVIDATKHEIIKTIPVGDKPEYVALTPDESFAFVTNLGADTVSVVDTDSLEVVKEIEGVGDGPHGIAFSANGDLAYISNMESSKISVINVTSGQVTGTFPSGGVELHQIVAKKPAISIISAENATATQDVYVDIADDSEEHSRGLMFKKSLEWNNGMLFVFEDEKVRSFWMENTFVPLDIIFVDSNFTIVDIERNAQPCTENDDLCQSFVSDHPAKFVLEVNADFVQENAINVGDRLSLNGSNNNRASEKGSANGGEEALNGSANAVAAARSFLLAKLPELGITISDEMMLHSDMVVAVTESEYRVDFSVIDSKGQSHSGFIETANGKVVHAVIDGRVFFSER
jgi:YVTN family beta-propeller protein